MRHELRRHPFLSARVFVRQEVCSTGHTLPTPVMIFLPSDESILESLEGMLVTIYKPVVTENFNAGRFGEITVAAERLWQFTQAGGIVRRGNRMNSAVRRSAVELPSPTRKTGILREFKL